MIRIPVSAPDFKNKSWTVAAEVTIPEDGATGVIATIGGRFGGWALLLNDNKPEHLPMPSPISHSISSALLDQVLLPGNHVVRAKFDYEGGDWQRCHGHVARGREASRRGQDPANDRVRFSLDETFDVGEDAGTPVVEDYADKMLLCLMGKLKKVTVVLELVAHRRRENGCAKSWGSANGRTLGSGPTAGRYRREWPR
ncbi:MAG: hypothetical protein R3D25_14420 [Geminicoccaceae bacterium]